jgi:hypothetical protein
MSSEQYFSALNVMSILITSMLYKILYSEQFIGDLYFKLMFRLVWFPGSFVNCLSYIWLNEKKTINVELVNMWKAAVTDFLQYYSTVCIRTDSSYKSASVRIVGLVDHSWSENLLNQSVGVNCCTYTFRLSSWGHL